MNKIGHTHIIPPIPHLLRHQRLPARAHFPQVPILEIGIGDKVYARHAVREQIQHANRDKLVVEVMALMERAKWLGGPCVSHPWNGGLAKEALKAGLCDLVWLVVVDMDLVAFIELEPGFRELSV